jgi:hypothetical protein
MINANELRIGNLAYNQYGKIGTVWGFKVGDATHDFEHIVSFKELNVNSCYSRYIQPIPLTPEILEKCGFDRNCILKIYQGVNIEWSYGKEVWLTKEGEVIYEFENTQHLHQLQNLYFALTNEELNYTP